MVAEDDIDMENLQAQIDMTMSFAHNLVSSWIKPTHKLAHIRSDVKQIFEEELRRPARLGVGASISAPLVYEASKLKHRLGKDRPKNDGVVKPQSQHPWKPDDEEYKGRPVKRKTKADPFGHESGKKKKKAESIANPSPSTNKVSELPAVPLSKNLASRELAKHDSSGPGNKQSHATEGQLPATLVASPPVGSPVQTMFSRCPTIPTDPSLLESLRETSAPVPRKPTTLESSQANCMAMPDKADVPLLNLDGPPEPTDKPGKPSEMNSSRKKRKGRKKKNQMIAGTESR